MYSCSACGYTTSHLCNLRAHLVRKKPCSTNIELILESKQKYLDTKTSYVKRENPAKCDKCDKVLKHRTSLYRHLQTCNGKSSSIDKSIEVIVTNLQNEVTDLKNQLEFRSKATQIENIDSTIVRLGRLVDTQKYFYLKEEFYQKLFLFSQLKYLES
jgi:hypothetical protein